MWVCSKCGEESEDGFDICWNCGTARDGTEDPGFRSADELPPRPQPPSTGPVREKLERVAKYQRWVILALLANLVANAVALATMGEDRLTSPVFVTIAVPIGMFSMVAVFLLAREFFHPALAVLCSLLMLAPCISLLMLFVVNQRATSYLRRNGVSVGFLGVDRNRIGRTAPRE